MGTARVWSFILLTVASLSLWSSPMNKYLETSSSLENVFCRGLLDRDSPIVVAPIKITVRNVPLLRHCLNLKYPAGTTSMNPRVTGAAG